MNITLKELYALLYSAYAVSINDDLYFIGTDGNGDPYAHNKNGGSKIFFAEVDGDIIANSFEVNFHINDEPIEVKLLELMEI